MNKKLYKELHSKYPNFVMNKKLIPILKITSPFIKRFKVEEKYEEILPKDGSLIFALNHSNFYDSLVFNKATKNIECCCLAGDEPRKKITGKSFEATGVVWVNRADKKSRIEAQNTLVELLKQGVNFSWCPEGTWNLSANRLMQNISYGLAKAAIEASETAKVYIIPTIIEYKYKNDTAKVEKATVTFCKAIEITKEMEYKKLTEELTTIYWTKRWMNLEEKAKSEKSSNKTTEIKGEGANFVYKRAEIDKEKWHKFIENLKKQYPTDWNLEASYATKTKSQQLQEEMEKYLPNIETNNNAKKLTLTKKL